MATKKCDLEAYNCKKRERRAAFNLLLMDYNRLATEAGDTDWEIGKRLAELNCKEFCELDALEVKLFKVEAGSKPTAWK